MKLKNKIGNLIEIDWLNDLHELQPDNVKVPINIGYLKDSILKHGFALPFAVWNDNGKYYCIDGHTRKQILTELVADGIEVPNKLKAFEILAKDRQEAIKILVEVYNQKHNPFAEEVLTEWLEVEEIEVEEIHTKSVNMTPNISKESYSEEDEEEVDLSKFTNTAESYLNNNLRQIVLIYENELHKRTLDDLADIGADFDITDDNSTTVLKLIEFYQQNK
ncbi:ParB N-terminal domain-containing protein [Capnocytophaga canis]|uniref:ParB N-terminal domain-containing protein n=1 Tax=Capnocytophaga canis TaxID=1848903 RepID=UPI00370DAC42